MAAPTHQQIKQAFDAFDTDKSGQISCVELFNVLCQCGVKVTQEQCGTLIKMFDADKSGQMEFPEFQKLISEALKHKH
jgi:Ca2+-binding EF-hand superfamily protein